MKCVCEGICIGRMKKSLVGVSWLGGLVLIEFWFWLGFFYGVMFMCGWEL